MFKSIIKQIIVAAISILIATALHIPQEVIAPALGAVYDGVSNLQVSSPEPSK